MHPLSLKTCKHASIMQRVVAARASNSTPSTPPPGTNPLDRVLQKASKRLKLAHPIAARPSEQKYQDPKPSRASDQRNASGRKASAQHKQAQQQQQTQKPRQVAHEDVDDDSLFSDITERERDDVWDAIRLEVEGAASSDNDNDDSPSIRSMSSSSTSPPARRRMAPTSARADDPSTSSRSESVPQPVASSSGFKGFGTPPTRTASPTLAASPSSPPSSSSRSAVSATTTSATSRTAPSSSPAASPSPTHTPAAPTVPAPGGPTARSGPLRVLLYNAEEGRTRSLLQQVGLAERVQVVSDLRTADLILSAKLARSGKHINLLQGERTAANAGIPFVVVGRNLTADNLKTALEPLLGLAPQAAAELVAARATATRGPSAEELRAYRLQVAKGFVGMAAPGAAAPSGRQARSP